jgi:hypothetical protein
MIKFFRREPNEAADGKIETNPKHNSLAFSRLKNSQQHSKGETMSNLKRLVVTFCLMSILAITALAGETPTVPCPRPEPGEIQAPPCAPAQPAVADPTNPGETQTPPAAETVVIFTIADAAIGALLSVF